MENEVAWKQSDNDFPMVLDEKGLNFSGRTAFFFYLSGIAATLSMIWVSTLSAKLLYIAYKTRSVSQNYIIISIMCLAVSIVSLYSFVKIYRARKMYRRQIEITETEVLFKETSHKGVKGWIEKRKKYEGITLKHYTYRKVESWYIVLEHSDDKKNIVLFAPSYDFRNASEEEKRELLARYGTKFNLLTTYSKAEEEVKSA